MDQTGTDRRANGVPASVDPMITIASAPEIEQKLRALVERKGDGVRVRLEAPADYDVSGHGATAAALTLTILDDEDDTEGHAISLHFPSVEEAKRFQQRMIMTGALVGTLVVAGTGLALTQANSPALDQARPDAGAAPIVSTVTGDVTSGGQAAADVDYGSAASAATPGSQAWADLGPGSAATGDVTSGGQAAADTQYNEAAATPGSQAWADLGPGSAATGDVTSGGRAAADTEYESGGPADDAVHRDPTPQ